MHLIDCRIREKPQELKEKDFITFYYQIVSEIIDSSVLVLNPNA